MRPPARWLRAALAAGETLLDAVYPPRCAGCDAIGAHFCVACAARTRPLPRPWCHSCGAPILAGDRCAECRLAPLPLHGVASAAPFVDPLRRAIHRLKYGGRRGAAPALAALMLPPARELLAGGDGPWLLVPVPLHPSRQAERGYNHAALLATPLGASLGLPYAPQVLRRLHQTRPQVGLTRAQRRENVRGAFGATDGVAGRMVLLLDDVATTGSTLASAAEACLGAGAAQVSALTLARET